MTVPAKIAFVCHPYHRGGVTSWMLNAAVAFSQISTEVFFVTVDPVKPFHSGRDREKMTDLLQARNCNVKLISTSVNYSFEFGIDEYRAGVYKQLITANIPAGVPLIVSDDISVWKGAASIADKYPMIGVLHGDQQHYYDKAKQFQAQLSVCVCVSGRIKKNALAQCGVVNSGKFVTIPCGIELPAFTDVFDIHPEIRLIFIGRLTDYEKRAEDLVKIAAALDKENIPFHMDIVGNSDVSAINFSNSFKHAGVDKCVTFHGWCSKDDIQKLLDRSDILLLTSNSEGMPLVMMEALASGCGFTGTRVSGIEDYECHPMAQNCVSVYTVGDIADAVSKIRKLLVIPFETRRQEARRLAEAEFSMKVCLDRYTDAIGKINIIPPVPSRIDITPIQMLYSKAIAFARHLKAGLTS